MLLDELLEAIPSDTETRVRRTKNRLNQSIRRILREETGLRFRRSATGRHVPLFNEEPNDPSSFEGNEVRIRLVAGLPKCLRAKQIDEAHRLGALIAPWRDSLEKLRESAGVTSSLAERLARDPAGKHLVESGPEHLPGAIELAERLLSEANKFDLANWILKVNEDVLGAYLYHVPNQRDAYFPQRGDSRIELYWGVIGLFSQLLAVDIEDLTGVVLSHELAHAYTHLGTDIDGHAWSAQDFANTEPSLKEGLAQYYAFLTCRRGRVATPKTTEAFEKLLQHQPVAYHAHKPWLQDIDPEQVRLSVLQTRRSGAATLVQFNQRLVTARNILQRTHGAAQRQI